MIKYSNIKKLTENEQAILKKVLKHDLKDIYQLLNNKFEIKVNIKIHDTDGKRKRYEIHINVDAPTRRLSTKTSESDLSHWKIDKAAHQSANHIKDLIKHKFKQESLTKKRGIRKLFDKFRM